MGGPPRTTLLFFFPVNWGVSQWTGVFPGGPLYAENVYSCFNNIFIITEIQTNTIPPQNMFGFTKELPLCSWKTHRETPQPWTGKNPKTTFREHRDAEKHVIIMIGSYLSMVDSRLALTTQKKTIHPIRKRMICFGLVWVQQAVHQGFLIFEKCESGHGKP